MQGDIIALSLNGSVIVQAYTGDHTSTMTAIASQANALGSVTATFTGSEIDFIATTAGVPFTLSDATITNFTTPVTIVINIPAVAQEVDFIPNGPVIEGLTYRVTINGENNDYLTSE
jgi:hypothetical protein